MRIMLKLIIKSLYILHLNVIVYYLLEPFFHKSIKYRENDMDDARNLLESLSPNPDNSCIREEESKLMRLYDLQVIVPAYKTANTIKGCIDSVLNQHTQYKILITVVNDGSPDNMDEVLREYEDDERVEIINQENKGLSGARNRGLDVIKADYVTFLDSDDEFLPNTLDAMLKQAKMADADLIEGGYIMFNKAGDKRTIRHKYNLHGGKLYGFPWGKLFKAQLFKNIKFPEGFWFEDTLMAFVIYSFCRKVVTSDVLFYHYRLNPNGITATAVKNKKVIDTYWITENLLEDRRRFGLTNHDFAMTMLDQIRTNYKRIRGLNHDDADKAVFILTIALWKTYFHDCQTNSPLQKALENNDFKAYRLICELT